MGPRSATADSVLYPLILRSLGTPAQGIDDRDATDLKRNPNGSTMVTCKRNESMLQDTGMV